MELESRLKSVLSTHGDVVAAWLFGSHARGTARPQSDVDVAVLLADEPTASLEGFRFDLAGELSEACGREVDLVVVNRASADLVHRVLRDGELLLDRDRSRRIGFEVRRRAEYLDLEPLRRAYRRQGSRP